MTTVIMEDCTRNDGEKYSIKNGVRITMLVELNKTYQGGQAFD